MHKARFWRGIIDSQGFGRRDPSGGLAHPRDCDDYRRDPQRPLTSIRAVGLAQLGVMSARRPPGEREPNWLFTSALKLVPTPPPINIVPVHFPDRNLAAARVVKKDAGEAVVIEIAFELARQLTDTALGGHCTTTDGLYAYASDEDDMRVSDERAPP